MVLGQQRGNTNASDRPRRRLVLIATITTVVTTLHFADHVIRGELVVDRGLNPDWNHSGWPFQPDFNPFDISVIVVYGLLLGGIVLTLRRQAWAGYWLATSIALAALALYIHFFEGAKAESPHVITHSYDDDVLGILALIVLFVLLAALAIMAIHALWVRRMSGRW